MGSDITYKTISPKKYEITLTVYRDCGGTSLTTSQSVKVECTSSTWSSYYSLTYIGKNDITGLSAGCTTTSRCAGIGGYTYGIEEYTFKATVDLTSQTTCSEFRFSWTQSARNSTITTGAANYQFYTEALVNATVSNTTPIFTTNAAALVCAGEDFVFNNGALDTVDAGDSLSYKLVPPLQAKNSPISYAGSWSATAPLTFLGFPNPNLPLPSGFHLDSITGDLAFRPTVSGQVPVIVLEITEWRNVGGVMTKVGVTRRDIQIMVINCGSNNLPVINGVSKETCPGQQTCINISTSDGNATDSVKLSWNEGIPNATFTKSSGLKWDTARVCWTPSLTDISNVPYTFTVTAKDNFCPLPGQSVRGFTIFVYEKPAATTQTLSLGCGHVKVDYTPNKNYSSLTQLWEARDSAGNLAYSSTRKSDTLLVPKGKVYIRLTLKALGDCVTSYLDSLVVPEHVEVHAITNDTFACQDKALTITTTTIDGQAPFHYVWNTSSNDSLTSLTLDTAKGYKYWITVTDAIGCTWWDSVRVRWDTIPHVQFTHATVCHNNAITFNNTTAAAQNDTFVYSWNFGDTAVSALKSPVKTFTTLDTMQVKLKVVSDKGCKDSTTEQVIVRPLPSASYTVNDTGQCLKGNRFDFTSTSSLLYGTMSYKWSFADGDTAAGSTASHIYTKDSTLFRSKLVVSTNFSCYDSVTKDLVLFPDPKARFNVNDTDQCIHTNSFYFTNTSTLKSGTMTYKWYLGNGDSSSAASVSSYSYSAYDTLTTRLIATSDKGCKDTATRQVIVWPRPQAGFTINDSDQCFKGNSFTYTNTSSIAYGTMSYFWQGGDGSTGVTQNFQRSYGSDINYRVRLTVTSSHGCQDTIGKHVYVRPEPVPKFTVNDSTQCQNNNLYVFANTSTVKYGTMGYNWNFGNGDTSTATAPSVNVVKDSTFRVVLRATTQYGCTDTAGRYIIVYSKPNPSFTVNDSTQCVNTDKFALTNTSAINQGTMTYRWYFGTGDSSLATNVNYGYTKDSVYRVTLKAISNYNCIDSFSRLMTVFPKPTAQFAIDNNAQCLNTNLFGFTGQSTLKQGTMHYIWNFGNGQQATGKDTIMVFAKDSTYSVRLITGSDEYCYDTIAKTVVVYPVPVVKFAANDSDQCLNTNNFIFNNQSSVKYGTMSYEWDFGGEGTSVLQLPSFVFPKDTFYTVKLKVTSDKSCKDSLYKDITVHPVPKVVFTINDTAQCVNTDDFKFTNASVIKYGTMSYTWYPGNGDSIGGTHASYNYLVDGPYTVTLKATSNFGCIDSLRKPLTVIAKPIARFAIDDSSQCVDPGKFAFTNQSSIKYPSVLTYNWDFDNSIKTTVKDTSISYLVNGNYLPTLITKTAEDCYDTFSRELLVYPEPQVDFIINADSQCLQTNNFIFTNTTTIDSGVVSYVWRYGDGTVNTPVNGQHTYTNDTIFTVWLKGTSDFGCYDSIRKDIMVMSRPQVEFTINDSGQCVNDNLFVFKNTSKIRWGSIASYQWDFANGDACNCTDTSVRYYYDSAFRVVLRATSDFGCTDTFGRYVIVHSKPTPQFAINDTDQCLETQLFDFTNTGLIKDGSFTTLWKMEDGQVFNTVNASTTFNNPDTITVKQVLTSNFGCKDSTTREVVIWPHPNPDFTGLRVYYCTDYPVLALTPVVSGGVFSGKNMAGDNYTPGSLGFDTITYTVQVNGCFNDTSKYTTVYPLPVLNLGGDTTLCHREVIFLDAGFPNSTYVWQDGVTKTPQFRVWQPGRYRVTMYNVCDTLTDEINVTFRDDDCNFYFPTAFTPNNDGYNDVFLPYFESDVVSMHLKIYDRWGGLVFESKDLRKGWDGTRHDIALPSDVYLWTVDLEIFEQDYLYIHSANGNVTLIR